MLRTIVLNGISVQYEFARKRVRNINLRIRRDGSVAVSASRYVPMGLVEEFLRERSDFILRSIARSGARRNNAMRPDLCRDGDQVKVFGEVCTIRVCPSVKNRVVFIYPTIYLYVKDPDDDDLRRRTYEKFRRDGLKAKVLQMCKYYYPRFAEKGVPYPNKISFRQMRSRWGSCEVKSKTLTFSYNLFEVPEEAIAYVVVHEFAHLIVADHSVRFYREVESVLPDYKARDKLLDEY